MKKLVLFFVLLATAITAQNPNAAAFPAAVATDTTLNVATNLPAAQRTLNGTITSGATSIVLSSGTGLLAPVLITIGSEIINCTTLTTATLSGCTRGAEGSTAAAHTTGANVYQYLTAGYTNQMAAEIKAVETALAARHLDYIAGGGTAQAQTAALVPPVASLAVGLRVCWLPSNANTATAPTLAVNGLTAKPITKTGTTALVANDLTTTAVACAIYDGTEFQLQNPQTGSGGGTVTTFSGSGPSWLTWTVSNPTSTPSVSIAPTTGQTSHQVIGTCGTATTFTPCSLVAADIPTLNQSTTGNAATATALAANPTDCAASNFATGIAANGDLTCSIPPGGVTSFNTRTGAVVPAQSDYSSAQLSDFYPTRVSDTQLSFNPGFVRGVSITTTGLLDLLSGVGSGECIVYASAGDGYALHAWVQSLTDPSKIIGTNIVIDSGNEFLADTSNVALFSWDVIADVFDPAFGADFRAPIGGLSFTSGRGIGADFYDATIIQLRALDAVSLWQKWNITVNGANFDITAPDLSVTSVAMAAATTQSLPIFQIPANGFVEVCPRIKTLTAFSGGAIATLTATMGTASNGTFFTSSPYDLKAAPSATNFAPASGICVNYGSTTASAVDFTLGLISTVANIGALTVGSVDVWVKYGVLP